MKLYKIFGLMGCLLVLSNPSSALEFSFNGGGGGGSPSVGASGAVQASNGSGGFLNGGLFLVTGAFSHAPSSATLTSTGQKFMSYDVSAAESSGLGTPTKFNFGVASFQNVNDACMGGNGRDNHVFTFGWNPTAAAGREDGTQSKLAVQMEQGFCITGVMGHEWHVEQLDSSGVQHRPISLWMPWDGVSNPANQGISLASNTTGINRYSTSANGTIDQQILKIATELTPWTASWYGRTVTEPMRLQSVANGCPWIQQRNGDDTAYNNYPCFRDINGVTAGGQEYAYSTTGSIPWYITVNPQAASTFSNSAFAIQSTTMVANDAVVHVQGPGTNAVLNAVRAVGGHLLNDWQIHVENSGGGNAILSLQSDSTSGGDPFVRYNDSGQFWAHGIDNSVTGSPWKLSSSNVLGTNDQLTVTTTGALTLGGNCTSSAAPAVCANALAGSVVIAAAATTVTVNTTAVTANSQILIMEDSSLGTKLGVTCNTTIARTYAVTARTAATSFVITTSAAPVTNPACLSYLVLN